VGEKIDADAHEKGTQQQHPPGDLEGKHEDKQDVKVGVDITTKLYVVQDQHLEEKKHDETYNIYAQYPIHSSGPP
jgi:hypothetical protein